MKPACMDAEEYAGWQRFNALLNTYRRGETPCRDCPMAFAAEMRAEGRCDGSPGIRPLPADPGAERRNFPPVARVPSGRMTGGRHHAYATEEQRLAARRETWRNYQRRRREKMMTTRLAGGSRPATVAA